ncbi:MAG: hypothetical protein ACK5JC_01925 [Bacteroidota bacterium]|jgi:hypothetical protein
MEKAQIKAQIESLKRELIAEKEKWKKKNEQFNLTIQGFLRQAAHNASRKDKLGKDAAARIKKEIANKKHSWKANEKRFEKEAYEGIKQKIENLKKRLSSL